MVEFQPFPKIPRFNSTDWILTEKLDGTNGQILIEEVQLGTFSEREAQGKAPLAHVINENSIGADGLPDSEFHLHAGSRNRWLARDADNFGFASWVRANADELVKLGPGRHFGEWYGSGVQRGYGLSEKRFALFNVHKWSGPGSRPACCEVVSILNVTQGSYLNEKVSFHLAWLRDEGSWHVRGFNNPEGLVIYHPKSGQLYKALCENDDVPKTQVQSDYALAA